MIFIHRMVPPSRALSRLPCAKTVGLICLMSFCEIRCPELFQRYVSRHEQTRTFIEPSDVGGSLRNAMVSEFVGAWSHKIQIFSQSEARLEERRRSRIEDMNSQRLERFRKSVDGRVKRIERMKGKEEKRRAERSVRPV